MINSFENNFLMKRSVFWDEKAISIAKETGAEEALSHALNNVGYRMPSPSILFANS
jgi:hypothetical protein